MEDSAILSNPKTAQNRIYVGNLTNEVTASLINKKFSRYGKILGLSRKGSSFCFIEFKNEVAAQKAIDSEDGTILCGRKIIVRKAEIRKSSLKRKIGDLETDESTYHSWNSPLISSDFHHLSSNDEKSQKITHCTIIIVDESLRAYAETIKQSISGLKELHVEIIVNDEFRQTAKAVRSQGGYYAIQVNKYHQMTRSMAVTTLVNVPRDYQNLSVEEGIRFIYNDYPQQKLKIAAEDSYELPEHILKLLNKMFYTSRLTTLQYTQLISFLENECNIQRKIELGGSDEYNSHLDTAAALKPRPNNDGTDNLQTRIYEILKRNRKSK